MKFTIENLGPIKKAEIELGDLTIICGKNSTGKTYITYSLIAFFSYIRHCQFRLIIDDNDIKAIKAQGEVSLDIKEYKERFRKIIEEKDTYFNDTYLSSFLATKHKQEQLTWKLPEDFINNDPYEITRNITATCDLKATWNKKQKKIKFQLTNRGEGYPTDETIESGISTILNNFLKEKFFSSLNLKSFTCERTVITLFASDLLAANFLKQTDQENYETVSKSQRFFYQLPVRNEITENLFIKEYLNTNSYLVQDHPAILSLLEEIIKGKYFYDKSTNQMMFIPEGTTDVILTMNQSSSTVRSLCTFDFFLRHQIQPHQTIVMDEPELNLHPENQRKLARLFAMLVNAGIKVMITTHSDYIIREFNMLIMLKDKTESHRAAIAKEMGYGKGKKQLDCLLDYKQVRGYVVENGQALPMDINQKYGMDAKSFNSAIEEFNNLNNRIIFGE